MVRASLRLAGVIASAAFSLTGCGGGGGGDDGGSGGPTLPLTITLSQNPITASVAQIDLPSQVRIAASVQGTTSATTVFVVIADSAGTFAGVPQITQVGSTQYEAALPLADSLAIGAHSGSLQISVCADQQCGNLLGRTSASYTITIAENPVLTGTWSPGAVSIPAVEGEPPGSWPARFTTPSSNYILFARVSDAANVLRIAGSSQTVVTMQQSTDVGIAVSPTVTPGTYTGNLDVVFCRDAACTKMYRGLTRLPYTVSVMAATNLKPLAPLAGAIDWVTVQGAAAHTGHVPVTLNPANFSQRWLWRSPDQTNIPEVLEPVTAGGKVFTIAAPNASVHVTPILFAIEEATGAVAWQQPLSDTDDGPTSFGLGPLTPPAIAGANVYVARTVNTYPPQEGRIFSFRVADGAAQFAPQNFPELPGLFSDFFYDHPSSMWYSQPAHLSPRNGSMLLLANDNAGRSFVALDQTTGARTREWASCAETQGSTQFAAAAAVDGGGASYLATSAGLLLADTCESIASTAPVSDGLGPALVPGVAAVVAVGGGNLVNFDTAARQVKWSFPSSSTDVFVGSPAVANGVIYVQNSRRGQLEARRENDGQILWTWRSPWDNDAAFLGNVIATENLVFLSTRERVYAIDIATRQTAWTYPYGGRLAMSANGVLYIRRGSTTLGNALVGVNLQ
jgi:outer membrane protein assembly factor BamB